MSLPSTLPPPTQGMPPALVVQHNNFVNARFLFGPLESRLFLYLLAQVGRHDTQFNLCRVEVSELMAGTSSQNAYKLVREAVEKFATRTLTIEQLDAEGRRGRQPDFVVLPLLSSAHYRGGKGVVEAKFNDAVRSFLLELRGNFTQAQLNELLKLKSPYSQRIYWLLREHAAFGQRTLALSELKTMFQLGPGYDRWDNFRTRILDRVQKEMLATDLPFTYELIKDGRHVVAVKFLFAATAALPSAAAELAPAEWEALLLAAGVSASSLGNVRAQLEAGAYDEGYVRYVVATVKAQVAAGKVKRAAGAVYKALTDGYLLADYQKHLVPPAKPRTPAALKRQREKLTNEIGDAENTLKWLRDEAPEDKYPGAKRAEAMAEMQKRVALLTQELGRL
jgi:hypothetical protein